MIPFSFKSAITVIFIALLELSVSQEWRMIKLKDSSGQMATSSSDLLKITASPNDLCTFDRLNMTWKIEESNLHELSKLRDVSLVVVRDNEDSGLEISLGSIITQQRLETTSTLTCLINDLFCQPKAHQINLLTDMNRLIVTFDHETNQPSVATREDIEKVLRITPALQHEASGIWIESSKLEVQLDAQDVANIIRAHSMGETTEVSAITPIDDVNYVLPRSGFRTFRTSEHGNFKIFAIRSTTQEIVSNVHAVTVQLCSEQSILPSSKVKFPSDRPAQSAFHMPGIFPITGSRAITVTNKAVPAIDAGTWSVAVWIKLLQEPTGSFRSVMFKGSPESGYAQRTPSVWLLPQSNHITLRVSTDDHPDTEINSHGEVPMNEWAHLCFVFKNSSVTNKAAQESFFGKSSDPAVSITPPGLISPPLEVESSYEQKYVVDFYLNGILDISGAYRSSVQGNNASLLFFKDVTFSGPKAFIEGLHIWDGALTPGQVKQLYSEGVRFNEPVDQVLELLEEADSPLLPYFDFHKRQKLKKQRDINQKTGGPTNNDKSGELVTTTTDGTHHTIEANNIDVDELLERENTIKKATNQGIVELLTRQSKESIDECQSYIQRLDIHSESSEMGSSEGFLYWSKLLYYGFEIPNSKCGFSSTSSDIQLQRQQKHQQHSSSKTISTDSSTSFSSNRIATLLEEKKVISITQIDENLRDLARAVFAFVLSMEEGKADGILPLAFTLLHGIGLESMIYHDYLLDYNWDIPIPLDEEFYEYQMHPRRRALRQALGKRIIETVGKTNHTGSDEWIGYSTLSSPAFYQSTYGTKKVQVDRLNQIALGLIYFAALYDQVDAYVALAYRFEQGIGGVIADSEMAAQYSLYPTDVASNAFHTVGGQPLVEADRIDDNTEPDLGKGNQGNDDEMIQYQKIRAAEGDIPSILAMGDLYYYGARGLPRDQPLALDYFNQAANLGDPQGMCGAAAMYLKGEGTSINVTKAVELYEKAADRNQSIRAYNGLGYLYFFGSQVPKNETKAFEYFQLAAKYENDGDSLFNSGYCLENGIGTDKNLQRAIDHYTIAAKKTGHFDSVKILGIFHMEGKGVIRSSKQALVYLNAAKGIGPWMGWIRRGFDLYLAHKTISASSSGVLSSLTSSGGSVKNLNPVVKSLLCFLYAGELGYEVAQSNAAYILRSKILPTSMPVERGLVLTSQNDAQTVKDWFSSDVLLNRLLFRQYLLSGKLHLQMESVFYLGNCYFFHRCGLLPVSAASLTAVDVDELKQWHRKKALYYYQIASYGKNPVASAYLGMIYHFNLHESSTVGEGNAPSRDNLLRANRYYEEVLQLATDPQSAVNAQSSQLYYFVRGLQTLLQSRSYIALYPVHRVADEVMRWFWK